MVHSNPLTYAMMPLCRDKLALQFKERKLSYPNVNLIIGELIHGNKHFQITDKNIINHEQLRISNGRIMAKTEYVKCWSRKNITK